MSGTTFDPEAYKRTTREQWQAAAEPWHRWGPTLEAWLGEATELMLDMARVGAGDRVLDVAAGAGGQTLAAARRVGPEGSVLATSRRTSSSTSTVRLATQGSRTSPPR
jgi:cyclopropane fatty-acyl-phospholipid synthase-like methyltransferase